METVKFRYFIALAVAGSNVDRVNGLIKNVSLISLGEAKGHSVFCDEATLASVVACIKTYKSGLKVKFNARTFNHGEGAILGVVPVSSVRVSEGQVLGTLEISKGYPFKEEVEYLYSLAEEQPDTFGLSIDFSSQEEEINGKQYMRCLEIYAVTVVDQPAANEGGMFKALEEKTETKLPKQPTKTTTMALEQSDMDAIKKMIAEAIAPLVAANEDEDEEEEEVEGMSDEEAKDEEMAAGITDKDSALSAARKLKAYRKKSSKLSPARIIALATRSATAAFAKAGGKPIQGGGAGADDNTAKDGKTAFEKRVAGLTESGSMSLTQATAFCVKHHGAEYVEHRKVKQAKFGRVAA